MNCLISICPTSLYFACTFKECFCWVSNSRLVVICFSAFYRCQSIIFWLPFSWKVSSQCCCAIKSHTFFPLRAWTFSSCLRHLQSCWNQCVVFIFESLVWFLSQLPVNQFSRSVSDPLRPHRLQHARLPCPSPTPGACSNSCPSCHLTISSSVALFSSCPQSFPESGSFPMSQLFTSGGQSIGASASASVLPMMGRADSLEKTLMLGKTEGRRRGG